MYICMYIEYNNTDHPSRLSIKNDTYMFHVQI